MKRYRVLCCVTWQACDYLECELSAEDEGQAEEMAQSSVQAEYGNTYSNLAIEVQGVVCLDGAETPGQGEVRCA